MAEATTRLILAASAKKLIPMVEALVIGYRLDRDQAILIGEGGGAGSLISYVSEVTGLPFEISCDAEVISSIGVALALVRETIERVIPNVRPEDLDAIRREASDAVVRLGADPGQVEVTVEVDSQTHRVRATSIGASEMRAHDLLEIDEAAALQVAAKSMALEPGTVTLAAATPRMRVFPPSSLAALLATPAHALQAIVAALADGRRRAATWAAAGGPQAIAAALGVPVVVAETGNRSGSVFQFAEYRSRPPGITIYRAAMDLLRTAIHQDALGPVLGLDDPEPVYLAHELYHHLDAAELVSIARAVLVTTVTPGLVRLRSGLVSLPEIAAAAFAAGITGLRCHPRLLDGIARRALQRS